MNVVFDIECDALVNPSTIWCIVAKDIDSGERYVWTGDRVYSQEVRNFFGRCERLIGHNIIDYDLYHLRRLGGVSVRSDVVRDTLVLSRLLNFTREGGHSLDAWGKFLGFPKYEFNKFDEFSDEMLEYCINDVELNVKVYEYLMQKNRLGKPGWETAINVEHDIAFICKSMQDDGFTYDWGKHLILYDEISKRVEELERELQEAFPPKIKVTQLKTKTKVEEIPFNPASPTQVVERLNEAGWQPTAKTEGHIKAEKDGDEKRLEKFRRTGWKVNEENLATLPADAPEAAHKLVEYLFLIGRKRTLEQWAAAYNPATGAIHATFNGIGTWTHRMSHTEPNLGNVAAPKSVKYKGEKLANMAVEYGKRMRELWTVPDEWWLVGTDADQIQLRIFAHYCDDPKLTEALINGRKEDRTDLHSINADILSVSRDTAKTFIYAFLLGAGNRKLGEIIGGTAKSGREARERFLEAYPGLKELKENIIPGDARRGYFVGFDGRLVKCDNEHLMLAGYLQNGETVVMKHANILWRKWLDERGIPYRQCNFVHDEWQTRVMGGRGTAELVGDLQARAIEVAGESLGVKCPLKGDYRIGNNWYETH